MQIQIPVWLEEDWNGWYLGVYVDSGGRRGVGGVDDGGDYRCLNQLKMCQINCM